MIFGFNTDVECGEKRLHVQSEYRRRENILETQVFVSGRCLGKVVNTATDNAAAPATFEDACQSQLREQHRAAVAAARSGEAEAWLTSRAPAASAGLTLALMADVIAWREGKLHVAFRVCSEGAPSEGAQVSAEVESEKIQAAGTTTKEGVAEIALAIAEAKVAGAVLIVRATAQSGCSAELKLRMRGASQSA